MTINIQKKIMLMWERNISVGGFCLWQSQVFWLAMSPWPSDWPRHDTQGGAVNLSQMSQLRPTSITHSLLGLHSIVRVSTIVFTDSGPDPAPASHARLTMTLWSDHSPTHQETQLVRNGQLFEKIPPCHFYGIGFEMRPRHSLHSSNGNWENKLIQSCLKQ